MVCSEKLASDILATYDVMKGRAYQEYDKTFFMSNEDLGALFNGVSLGGKSALSVIGSGDQAFHLIQRGTRNIDLFDYNPLAIYYFYLRLWSIRYLNEYYLDSKVEHGYVKKILSHVVPQDDSELQAYEYWKKVVDLYSEESLSDMFIYERNVLNKIDDISDLKKKIDSAELSVFNIDISCKFAFDRKYDFIYISNILEWIHNVPAITRVRDNLYHHLNDDGIVMCSNICREGESFLQAKCFDEFFSCEALPEAEVRGDFRIKIPGYCYTKKK